jgi:hypothetical protein
MSIASKKKDKDKGDPGGEASANYIIGESEGGKERTDARKEEEATIANRVASSQERVSTQKYKATSRISSTEDENLATEPTTMTTGQVPQYQLHQLQQQQREQQQSLSRGLDETKDNIRRSIDEARREIPRYTQAANDYQEQTIQAARELADNYIESQKEIINLLQSAWLPHIESANRLFTTSWVSPRKAAEIYANMVSIFADNIISAIRLVNNMTFVNMNMFKNSMLQAKDNARELSRIGVNTARTFERTSRDTATTTGIGSGGSGDNTSTTSRVYVEREQEGLDQRRI